MESSNFSPKVSVIIPTKNEESVIQECLLSIFCQSLKPLEVIIVDGRSTDSTLKIAGQFPVKIIIETEPTSLPHARNLGIESAEGEIIFLMDADLVLDKDCIKNAARYFGDQSIMAVIPTEKSVAHTSWEKIQIDWLHGTANRIRNGIGILSLAEFIKTNVFTKLSFDAKLGYGEDADFQRKLIQLYGPSAIVQANDSYISIHYPHTFKESWSQWTWYGRTFSTFLRKHFSLKTLLNLGSLLAPTLFLFALVLTPFFFHGIYFLVLLSVLLLARNLLACYRSKSIYFGHFVAFEFIRSLSFEFGLIQGVFSKKRGK